MCFFPWNLEVRTHTIEETIKLFKIWFLTIRNKELKGYNFILESVCDVRLFKRLDSVLKFYSYFYD